MAWCAEAEEGGDEENHRSVGRGIVPGTTGRGQGEFFTRARNRPENPIPGSNLIPAGGMTRPRGGSRRVRQDVPQEVDIHTYQICTGCFVNGITE